MDYRIYTLSSVPNNPHFVSVEEISCAGDLEAVAYTRHSLNGRIKEVWHRGRLVERLLPDPKADHVAAVVVDVAVGGARVG